MYQKDNEMSAISSYAHIVYRCTYDTASYYKREEGTILSSPKINEQAGRDPRVIGRVGNKKKNTTPTATEAS